ncbi:hypothetical protein B0H11DRAFT_674972 [Mycena galericulata]|nr:hypothetical protein B0H11DRAFT_674972 [Mycena galericulata]
MRTLCALRIALMTAPAHTLSGRMRTRTPRCARFSSDARPIRPLVNRAPAHVSLFALVAPRVESICSTTARSGTCQPRSCSYPPSPPPPLPPPALVLYPAPPTSRPRRGTAHWVRMSVDSCELEGPGSSHMRMHFALHPNEAALLRAHPPRSPLSFFHSHTARSHDVLPAFLPHTSRKNPSSRIPASLSAGDLDADSASEAEADGGVEV